MFSFRKIISTLVLISYIKTIMVTSFAMEPIHPTIPSRAILESELSALDNKLQTQLTELREQIRSNQLQILSRLAKNTKTDTTEPVNPAMPAHLKLQVDLTKTEDKLQSIRLRVFNRADGKTKTDYVEHQSDTINLTDCSFTQHVKPYFDGIKAIEWTIPGLGKVFVGYDGRVSLEDIKVRSGTLKVKTPGLVLLRDCFISNLILDSFASVQMGGNRLLNLTAKHDPSAGVFCFGQKPNHLTNFLLKSGHFHNAGRIETDPTSYWDLSGNALINYNLINIKNQHTLCLVNSLMALNLGTIQGDQLKTLGLKTLPTPAKLTDFYKTLILVQELAMGLVETEILSQSILGSMGNLYPILGGIVNMGQICLARSSLTASEILNHVGATLKTAQETFLSTAVLRNKGTVILGDSKEPKPLIIRKLVNLGTFESHTPLRIGQLKTTDSSRIRLHNGNPIEIESPFKLCGTLHGMGGLNLTGTGENLGHINLETATLSTAIPLPFNYDGVGLKNTGLISSAHPIQITGTGTGTLDNQKIIEAPSLKIALPQVRNAGRLNGERIQIDTKKLDNNHGDIQAAGSVSVTADQVDNLDGKIHAANSVNLETSLLDNKNGSISGIKKTSVHMKTHQFHNADGVIGAAGETKVAFEADQDIGALGLVKGALVELQDLSSQQSLTLNNGRILAEQRATLAGKQLKSAGVSFHTPELCLHLIEFILDHQADCARTIWCCTRGQDLEFTHDYRTTGTFEIWRSGFTSRKDAVKAMMDRFGDRSKPIPAQEHIISMKALLQADKGFKVYAPEAALHFPDNLRPQMTEILVNKGDLDFMVTLFDLERAGICALSAQSWAPMGHRIGRLEESPIHKLFASFFHPTYSHNLNEDIFSPVLTILGKQIGGVYDGRHLITAPVVAPNGSSFLIKNETQLTGHLEQRAFMETGTLEIDSDQDSICEASTTQVNGNCTLNGRGGMQQKRHTGNLDFKYNQYTPGVVHQCYQFMLSGPNIFNVTGKLSASNNNTITVQGSQCYTGEFAPGLKLQSTDEVSSLHCKIVDMTSAEGDIYRRAQSLVETIPGYIARFRVGDIIIKNIFAPNPHQMHGRSRDQSAFFHAATNKFSGSQKVFPAQVSSSTGGHINSSNTSLQGNISMPLMLISHGAGHLALGSPNPYYIAPKNPIQDLTAKGFNVFTTYIAPDLKELLAQAYQSNELRLLFKLREKFWFDEARAQEFYRQILDHVIIITPTGVQKPGKSAVFTLSPKFLIDTVRQTCQDTLMRGYIYDNRPIDEDMVRELHLNAAEYFNTGSLDPIQLSTALTTRNSRGIRLPDKPLIFYKSMLNEHGVDELSPQIYFPIPMLNEARAERGGLIRTHILAIAPKGFSAPELIEYYADKPQIQEQLASSLQEHPEIILEINRQAEEFQQQRALANGKATSSSTPSDPDNPSSWGSASFHGTITTDTFAPLLKGKITSHAHIQAANAFLGSLYDDVVLESKKERAYDRFGNFSEHVAQKARVLVTEILNIYSGQNVIFIGSQTQSRLGTHIRALANLIDIPIELMASHVETWRKKRKSGQIEITTSTVSGSDHTVTDGAFIATADNSVDMTASKVTAKKIGITATHDINLRDAHDTVTRAETSTSKGHLGKKTTTQSQSSTSTSQGNHFKSESPIDLTALLGDVSSTNTTFDALETNISALQGIASLLQGVNHRHSSFMKNSGSLAWNKMKMGSQEHQTYAQAPLTGTVNITAQKALVELVHGQSDILLQHLKLHGTDLQKRFLKEIHKSEFKRVQGPGQALMAVIAIAISCVTAGSGAALASAANQVVCAMIDAAVASVSTQMANATLSNGDNPFKALKSLTSADYLKSLAISVASAGAMAKFGAAYGIKKPDASALATASSPQLLAQQARYHFLCQGLNATLKSTINGESLRRNLKQGAKSAAIDTVAGFASNKAGQWYADGTVDYLGNKALHFGIGASLGYATSSSGDSLGDALTAGVAATSAEIIAETLEGDPTTRLQQAMTDVKAKGLLLTPDNINNAESARLNRAANTAKFAVSFGAFLMGQDANLAAHAACNAVENDFLVRSLPVFTQNPIKEQLVKTLKEQLYQGNGNPGQIKQQISEILRQDGATDSDIAQIMSGKVGQLIEATSDFHTASLNATYVDGGISIEGLYRDPGYFTKGLQVLSAAAVTLEECAREHPHLTRFTLTGIELALGGISGYVSSRISEGVGLTQAIDRQVEQGEAWICQHLQAELNMNELKAKMLAASGSFGLMFGLGAVVGSSTDKILNKAEEVAGKVKGYFSHKPHGTMTGQTHSTHAASSSAPTSGSHLPEFRLQKTDISKTYKHDKFGKFHRNKADGLYYAKDTAGHGGSAWKAYRETGKGLEWERDIDKFGRKIDKHKGDIGKFIPKKDLNGVSGK